MSTIRLQRFLAQGGVAARRKAEVLIAEGRVKVNGKVCKVLGTKIDPTQDRVAVDGQAVHPEELFYAVFNKPKGCITAVSDPEGRRTVMEYMPGLPASAMPVGRLDFYSEGVLLLTNDGVLSAALTSSRKAIEKVYHIKLKGNISDREIETLRKGVKLDHRTTTKPCEVQRLKARSRHDWLEVVLTEGKNRQLHRMCEAIGHEIVKLQRISFAGITFHGLRVGDARELTQQELKELYAQANVSKPKGLTTRGKWVVKRETTEKARRNADRSRERVTPNLTPGGSKKAKAKLLTRYREQEEDGTLPPPPVPRALKEKAAKARGPARRPDASKPARATSPRGGNAPASRSASRPTSRPTRGGGKAPTSRPTRGGGKAPGGKSPGTRPTSRPTRGGSKAPTSRGRSGAPKKSGGSRSGAAKGTARRGGPPGGRRKGPAKGR